MNFSFSSLLCSRKHTQNTHIISTFWSSSSPCFPASSPLHVYFHEIARMYHSIFHLTSHNFFIIIIISSLSLSPWSIKGLLRVKRFFKWAFLSTIETTRQMRRLNKQWNLSKFSSCSFCIVPAAHFSYTKAQSAYFVIHTHWNFWSVKEEPKSEEDYAILQIAQNLFRIRRCTMNQQTTPLTPPSQSSFVADSTVFYHWQEISLVLCSSLA